MTPPSIGKLRCPRTVRTVLGAAAMIAGFGAPATGEPVPGRNVLPELVVPDPSPAEPVKAAIRIEAEKAVAGNRCEVVVRVRIAAGHHIYAMEAAKPADAAKQPFLPTSLSLKLPEALEADGDWSTDPPTVTKTGERVYTGSVVFRRPCKVRSSATAAMVSISSTLRYQACDTEVCWPPSLIDLSTEFAITNPKPTRP